MECAEVSVMEGDPRREKNEPEYHPDAALQMQPVALTQTTKAKIPRRSMKNWRWRNKFKKANHMSMNTFHNTQHVPESQ